MRIRALFLPPLAALAIASLTASTAEAAKTSICFPRAGGVLCYYAVDYSDCIVVDGQDYCRTIGIYRWEL